MSFPTSIENSEYFQVAYDNLSTTLTQQFNSADTIAYVSSTENFPSLGWFTVEDDICYYTGKTAYSFTGVTHGVGGTTPADHVASKVVSLTLNATAWNRTVTELRAAQTKIGVNSSADTSSIDYKLSGVTNENKAVSENGWTPANETWTYASADDPTFTFTISGDKTSKYSAGMRIRISQTTGGTKYFIITKVSYSDPNTTITIYGGTDYNLENEAISSPYYSVVKAPIGFPLDPNKWTVQVSDDTNRTQNTPTQNVWYNIGATYSQIDIPIGVWKVQFKVCLYIERSTGSCGILVTLSTANNTESNKDFTAQAGGSSLAVSLGAIFMEAIISLDSKTKYYLNAKTSEANIFSLMFLNSNTRMIIRAVSAYL